MNILEVKNLEKDYLIPRSFRKPLGLKALRGLDFQLLSGETLAIVGESGCGKSTLAKVLLKLEDFSAGEIKIDGIHLSAISKTELPNYIQMVFQDPSSSLNPRKKVYDLIAEPLRIQNKLSESEIKDKVLAVAKSVSVGSDFLDRYSHMMSGGQRQRVGIARALVTRPKIIVLDEPVSALDVSVQAQVLNLLLDIRDKEKISFLFISHDLSVVRFIAHKVAVLYLGKIVEIGTKKDIFESALHPYTQLLLRSTPSVFTQHQDVVEKSGELPSPLNPPIGCAFASRCSKVSDICLKQDPQLTKINNRLVVCHHAEI